MSDTAERFDRGASIEQHGIKIAYAMPTEGKPPRFPDRRRWWIEGPEGWRLIDLKPLAARTLVRLPAELTEDYFVNAYLEQMRAAARFLAAITALPAPAPPAPEDTTKPRYWWLD